MTKLAFVSTENIKSEFSKSFASFMDSLMRGVASGFDVKGADKICVTTPTGQIKTIVVDDSREGWINAVSCLIDSYLKPNSQPVKINNSLVRPYSNAIAGLYNIRDVLEKRAMSADNRLSSMDIVDIMNLISTILATSGTPRTAEIILTDEELEQVIK